MPCFAWCHDARRRRVTIAERLIVFILFMSWPWPANAEVMDKVSSTTELWLFSSGPLIVALLLGVAFHPLAAFAVYPLSLFLTWMILDLLWGDLRPAAFSEAGWPFLLQGYAMAALGIVGPAVMYLIARKWRLTS